MIVSWDDVLLFCMCVFLCTYVEEDSTIYCKFNSYHCHREMSCEHTVINDNIRMKID